MIQTDNFFPLKRLLEWNIEHELELTTLSLKKGDVFLEKGQRSDYLYFVLHGFFRIYYYDLEGNEMTHVFCYDNSLATSPFSFFKGEENILYFKCHEDTELIQMTAVQLETLIAKENLGHVIRRLFLEFGMLMSRRVMSIHTETAEERYLKMMESYPKIFQKATLTQIASYLGITPQSLSRIRKNI